ncbi:MAG: HEAT repeat domain-containing protein [Planctomycetota bacterium]|jgi:HEAT repeat protein
MLHRSLGALCALLLFALSAHAEDWAPPTDKKELKRVIKETIDEYDALSGNHDLVQKRRRRELLRRMGQLPDKKTVKALRRIVRKEGDTRAKINAMYSLCTIGDVKAVNDIYKFCLKEIRSVYPAYLGRALAHTKDPEVMAWIIEKPLKNTNPRLRLSAIEALGELRYAEALPHLIAIFNKEANKEGGRNIVYMYESIKSIGRIGGPDAKPVLMRAAKDKDWRVRLGVAESLLDRFRDRETLEAMRTLMKEDSQIIREECAKSIRDNKVDALFPELIVTMREGNLRCKKASYDAMKAISGQDFSLAPDLWAKWWAEKKKGNLTEEGKLAKGERVSVSTYYNFKIFSDRVLFVIDTSGSMKWLESPPQRIDVAREQLFKAIKSLNEKTLFNVMTFASDIHTWKRGEVLATKENIAESLKWLETRLLPRGGTNTHGALMRALSDNPKIDTVYFLSDGLPSSGEMEIQEEIIVALRDANRFRKVVFNTIALVFGKSKIEKAWKYEDPEEMGAFMRRIAEESAGESVVIDRPFFDLDD